MIHHRAALAIWMAVGLAQAPAAERAQRLAESSPMVAADWRYLQDTAAHLQPRDLRDAVQDILSHPVPTFLPKDAAAARERWQALERAGLVAPSVRPEALFPALADEPQSFLASPGNTLDGHHAYPGGLVSHTVFNLRSALGLARLYREHAGVASLDLSTLEAAVLLHDAFKPYVLRWQPDGTLSAQEIIAGTAAHHIFAVAEALHRHLPGAVIVALASAHDAPGISEERVVGFLRAAAILAGEDPLADGLVMRSGNGFVLARPAPFEASINHLADHDYVITEPAAHAVNAALERLARASSGGAHRTPAELRWMRYRIESRVPFLGLYQALLLEGDAGVARALQKAHVPLLAQEDL